MKFNDIAKFLNIPEKIVRSLAQQMVLPGQPHADAWETTFEDIERWYVKLSGREWADLVADGHMDSLKAEVDLEGEVSTDTFESLLKSWQQSGLVTIISQRSGPSGNPEILLTLDDAAERGKQGIESLKTHKHTDLVGSTRSNIELSFRCERTLGENAVVATLLNNKVLRLRIEDDMAELPQREREIIRFYLASYALRLSAELRP